MPPTHEQTQLAEIRLLIAQLDTITQADVARCAQAFREILVLYGEIAQFALALVGAEAAAED